LSAESCSFTFSPRETHERRGEDRGRRGGLSVKSTQVPRVVSACALLTLRFRDQPTAGLPRLDPWITTGRARRRHDLEGAPTRRPDLYLPVNAGRRANHPLGLCELVTQRLVIASTHRWRFALTSGGHAAPLPCAGTRSLPGVCASPALAGATLTKVATIRPMARKAFLMGRRNVNDRSHSPSSSHQCEGARQILPSPDPWS
jgi:hypothetical protein